MTSFEGWRPISADEARVISDVVVGSGNSEYRPLLDKIDEAEARHEAAWVLDIRTSRGVTPVGVPVGPLPVRVYVTSGGHFHGEVLLWVENGRLSGLEYAWVTDEPPSRWPASYEMEIAG